MHYRRAAYLLEYTDDFFSRSSVVASDVSRTIMLVPATLRWRMSVSGDIVSNVLRVVESTLT